MSEDKIYPSMVIRSQAEAIELLEQENKQLKDNWNELKKWLEKQLGKGFSENEIYIDVIYKMQELEQEKDERG